MTISSYNLAWDYQDATDTPVKTPVLQPVLVSSSYSCNGRWGSGYDRYWYQPGAHTFDFSLTSGASGDNSGHKLAIGANNPLEVKVQTQKTANAALPVTFQGFGVDQDNVIVTAIKKAEDNMQDIVVRFYEAEGSYTGDVKVAMPTALTGAKQVNLIERETGNNYSFEDNAVVIPTSPWSIETAMLSVGGIEDAPMAPQNLRVQADGNIVTLKWTCKDADTYEVERCISGSNDWQPMAEDLTEPALQQALNLGRYQFRVRSLKNGKQSDWLYSDVLALDSAAISVTATSSSAKKDQGPEKVVDGSGLTEKSDAGKHDNGTPNCWITDQKVEGENEFAWIQFDFGGIYPLGKTYIWNFNQDASGYNKLSDASLKYVQIWYQDEHGDWNQYISDQCTDDEGYTDYFKFARANGEAALGATNLDDGTVLDFAGLNAQAIEFRIPNEVGIGSYDWYVKEGEKGKKAEKAFGLSEVLFTVYGADKIDPSVSTMKRLEIEGGRFVTRL